MDTNNKWDFWIDCGGTFTDIVAIDTNGSYQTEKLLTKSPHYKSSVVQGIKNLLGDDFSPKIINKVRLGTTVATNAFLERDGIDCALVTTLGFRDLLEIRRQNRPRLFDLDIKKAKPLYKTVVNIKERIDASGNIITKLDEEIAYFELMRLYEQGLRSVAIALMHSCINPEHELKVAQIAKKIGFEYISLSHETSPISKYVYRAETSVVDAYLTPLLDIYTKELEDDLGGVDIVYMQSNGGLCDAKTLKGQNTLLSGPAGGLIGAIKSSVKRDINKIITFDMGGTSTDVAIYDGEIKLDNEPDFLGIKLLAPMLDIHTVAAGGGSILKFDGGRFAVGPESAGAFPGPACYRNGGPLTVTDANLFLGRLEADKFPKIFGPNRNQALDEEIVSEKFNKLAKEAGMDAKEVAEGFLDVAASTMARAIKKVSVEKGEDPADFTMVSFGGAAGQMACKVADAIGIKKIFVHPFSSVLSAYGIGTANESFRVMKAYTKNFSKINEEEIKEKFTELHKEIEENLNNVDRFTNELLMRAKGSDYEINVSAEKFNAISNEFSKAYEKLFGVEFEGEAEVVSLVSTGERLSGHSEELIKDEALNDIEGPALLSANNTCLVFDEGWRGSKNKYGEWILTKEEDVKQDEISERDAKVELEIYYQRFQSIAEQMGHTLQNLAHSITIKERNDFSCALFTKDAELLANAPHIPVHLGSMGDAVKAIAEKFNDDINEGDGFICNDPNYGGTHLPDITAITPIFFEGKLSMYVASRGHHADIGGISPGSMPGKSTKLSQEGVVIAPERIIEKGRFLEEKLSKILKEGQFPARIPIQNIHDIKAQFAANQKARTELHSLVDSYGAAKTLAMAEAILAYSHKKIIEVLKKFKEGTSNTNITNERSITVKMTNHHEDKLVIDFTGTSPCGDHNFNTPLPVVKASILFALRCLIKEEIPLNDGIARYLDIKIPKGSLLNPSIESAVVAGNVETSQVICDLIFESLGVKAHGQGTMNNLSFGNEEYQYYETLGGGAGASSSGDGASAIQVGMTNSLLTDPEVFESRLPVRIELMGIRQGSGGIGEFRGGSGIYRHLLFLQDSDLSMISQRRLSSPTGINGGEDGLRGKNILERKNGEVIELEECFQTKVEKMDRLMVCTPGGGGFGKAPDEGEHLVFGFGSNMDISQIRKRCPSSSFVTRARLDGYELRYTTYSEVRKGGVADMYEAPGKSMWGAIYRLNDHDLATLDEIECSMNNYTRIQREVNDDNGRKLKVYCYDVNDKEPDISPTNIYHWLVYSGAYNLGTLNKYLKAL
ncbi:hydantoinase B/oxoprolinase family protein [Halobacteriovorax sp.]|uniref:hydantoinase B/oxoprolinase family protein n=1 Tax=Halobacteriovorax sp. TaxID=2020862 RepID=UPI003AF2B1F7